jgi:hypothetical protein
MVSMLESVSSQLFAISFYDLMVWCMQVSRTHRLMDAFEQFLAGVQLSVHTRGYTTEKGRT